YSGAALRACARANVLDRDMAADVLQLRVPPLGIHAERFGAAPGRNAVEAGLDDRELRPRRHLLEPELDERRRLLAVVALRIDRVGVPAEREQPLGIHPFHDHGEREVLVAGIADLPRGALADGEPGVQLDPEPGAELAGVGERAPDARRRRLQDDLLLD